MPRSVLGRTREYASEIPEYGVLTGQLRLRTLSLSFLRAEERRCRGIGLLSRDLAHTSTAPKVLGTES